MKILCIMLLAVFLQLNHALPTDLSFIMNGFDAKLGDFPHQLYLQNVNDTMGTFIGSAVLISPTQAITAAHCVDDSSAEELRVIAGMVDIYKMKDAQMANVQKVVMHPKYGKAELHRDYDLAILTFTAPLKLNKNVQSIAWNQDENLTFTGKRCVLSGWGETEYGTTWILQKVTTNIISNLQCMGLTTSLAFSPRNICAYQPYSGTCYGDSGGPMTCTHNGEPILAGIVSWVYTRNGRCDDVKPSIYARLSHYKQFILDNLVDQ